MFSEVLAERFKGIAVCDGWKSHPKFTKQLQRCWAHLLRESKALAEKVEESVPLHSALKELYEELNSKPESSPPPGSSKRSIEGREGNPSALDSKEFSSDEVRKLIGKDQQWL